MCSLVGTSRPINLADGTIELVELCWLYPYPILAIPTYIDQQSLVDRRCTYQKLDLSVPACRHTLYMFHTATIIGYRQLARVNCNLAIALLQLQLLMFDDSPIFPSSHSATLCITPLQLLKIKKSTARNELSYETEHKSEEAESFGEVIARRIQVTAEVAVSKIFPAGK